MRGTKVHFYTEILIQTVSQTHQSAHVQMSLKAVRAAGRESRPSINSSPQNQITIIIFILFLCFSGLQCYLCTVQAWDAKFCGYQL